MTTSMSRCKICVWNLSSCRLDLSALYPPSDSIVEPHYSRSPLTPNYLWEQTNSVTNPPSRSKESKCSAFLLRLRHLQFPKTIDILREWGKADFYVLVVLSFSLIESWHHTLISCAPLELPRSKGSSVSMLEQRVGLWNQESREEDESRIPFCNLRNTNSPGIDRFHIPNDSMQAHAPFYFITSQFTLLILLVMFIQSHFIALRIVWWNVIAIHPSAQLLSHYKASASNHSLLLQRQTLHGAG